MVEQRQARFRYAVYLIPPYQVARPVAEIHGLLRKQYGLVAADRFPVHATIKGFFLMSGGPLDDLVARLDDAFEGQRPIPIYFCGLHRDPVGLGLDISCLGLEPNPGLVVLRERVLQAVGPFVDPDCAFSVGEQGRAFAAHITLAFRDLPEARQDDVLDYLQDAPLPSETFMADRFQFLEFSSQDWGGDWHQDLTWRIVKTWQLTMTQIRMV